MPRLHVCSLERVAATVKATGARSLVTLLKHDFPVERPRVIAPENHLRLGVNDVVEAAPGMIVPQAEHAALLVDFARAWDRREPMVIHCFAGVSRSTAAAFIAACALMPARAESDIANELRRLSPTATPNALLVRHADALLARGGAMMAAVAAIGRGEECSEGAPFALEIA